MSELKEIGIRWEENGELHFSHVYRKSEADKVISELKEKLKVQTSIAEEGWKLKDTYHDSYAEAVKELYEKNKELRYHKYKRCLKNREICVMRFDIELARQYPNRTAFWAKWERKWLKLAEKFKEAK